MKKIILVLVFIVVLVLIAWGLVDFVAEKKEQPKYNISITDNEIQSNLDEDTGIDINDYLSYDEKENVNVEQDILVPSFLAERKPMNWTDVFTFPTEEEIATYNATAKNLAPYICGWLDIPGDKRYTEYVIDFKADYLPNATYCCLSNWKMDYSSLSQEYTSYRTEYDGVHAYAGFQSLADGERVSIMSFWDIFCKDAAGNETVIRAKLVYPEATDNDSFGGEGTGAHCLVPYPWEAGKWYRMRLLCTNYENIETTVVEQWVCDVEADEWTLLCAYDTGVKDACFKGNTAIFLEDYLPQTAGEIRSMEVCGAMYRDVSDGQWKNIEKAYLSSNGGLPKYEGSYRYGTKGSIFWMITSGVGGDMYGNGTGQIGYSFSITN